ncbi:hypothetical protein V4Y02_23615, partial [Escherichia coli]
GSQTNLLKDYTLLSSLPLFVLDFSNRMQLLHKEKSSNDFGAVTFIIVFILRCEKYQAGLAIRMEFYKV